MRSKMVFKQILIFTILLLGLVLDSSTMDQPKESENKDAKTPYDYVNPFIGTGGEGHTFPGAALPFGMVQLSPDTEIKHFRQSFPWCAGYRYEDKTILGFSHTHFSGTGHSDMGDILIMPTAG